MLRLYHAHVQMVLYRPFLHHTLQTPSRDDRLNMKAYACGSACVKASMQVVWLVEKMHNSNVLNVAQWFFSQIIANTAACLVLFVSGARNSAADEETLLAIDRLRQICLKYADRSDAMRKCLAFLEVCSFPTSVRFRAEFLNRGTFPRASRSIRRIPTSSKIGLKAICRSLLMLRRVRVRERRKATGCGR